MSKKKRKKTLNDLKEIQIESKEKDIYSLPYKKQSSPKNDNPQENELTDDEVFMAAMQGVKEITSSTGRQVSPRAEAGSKRQDPDPERESKKELEYLLHGKIDFELEFTDEFMYGYVKGLDIKTFKSLKSGALSVTSHLDLHGMTSDQAQENLLFFIRESYLNGHRCVLVVTGRGKNSPGGQSILRRETETWLTREPLKRIVLAYCTSQPKDGGAGAIYVLLRKQKKDQGKIRWNKMFNWEEKLP